MSGRVIPLHPEPPVDRRMTLDQAQRLCLAIEDQMVGPWSDSCLIALLPACTPRERQAILDELEARARR